MGPWCSPFDKAEALVEFSLMPSLPANLPGTFHLPKRGSAFRADLVPHLCIPGLHCLSSVLPVLCFNPILTVRHREYGSVGSAAQMLLNKCVCVCEHADMHTRSHVTCVHLYFGSSCTMFHQDCSVDWRPTHPLPRNSVGRWTSGGTSFSMTEPELWESEAALLLLEVPWGTEVFSPGFAVLFALLPSV